MVVVYGHSFPLSGTPDVVVLGNPVQSLAVKVFFVISGYLITESWFSDPNLFRYFTKRILRIFPALIFVVCLSALVLGPVMSTLPVFEYLRNPELIGYFRNIYLFPVYNLPDVFVDNIYPSAVNGSLWSLPVEFSMYIMLPLLALWFRGAAFRLVFSTLFVCAVSLYELRGAGTAVTPAVVIFGTSIRSALDAAPYFLIGASLRSLAARMRPNIQMAMLLAGVALLVPPVGFCPELALYVVLPYAVIAFGRAKPGRFAFVDRIGDLSYGTYLFGFPVQQLVIQAFGTEHHPILTCGLALLPTLLLAFISWHLLERRMMAMKPRRPSRPPEMSVKRHDFETPSA